MSSPTANQTTIHRGLGGRVVLLALLALFTMGGSALPETDACDHSLSALGMSSAPAHWQVVRRSEHTDRCTDGTTDRLEDDDSGCKELSSPRSEAAESLALAGSPLARPTADGLVRSHPARGPPSA